MEDTKTTAKLELIQALRQEQNINNDKIKKRSQILYGGEKYESSPVEDSHMGVLLPRTSDQEGEGVSTFRFRLLLAILLFVGFFLLDQGTLLLGEFSSDMIIEAINHEVSVNFIDFME